MKTKTKPARERRAHDRIRIQHDAFAVIQPGGDRLLVPILDLSLGGLSFRYTENLDWQTEDTKLDLLLIEEELYLEGLAVRRVSDIEFQQANADQSGSIRKQSVRFDALSPFQRSWLDHFVLQCQKPPYTGPERRNSSGDRRSGLDRRLRS